MRSLLRKLAVSVICIILACLLARSFSYRDPGSVFFDKERAYEQQYSQHRKAEITELINSFTVPRLNDPPIRAGSEPSLCAAMSSVTREHTQYIEIAIGSLIHGLLAEERADLHIAVLIAESDPSEHPTWHKDWVHRAVDEMFTYNTSAPEKDRLKLLKQTGAYAEKGVYDYTYALQRCYDTGAPYIGMFEDDIMLADGWLVRTLLGLTKIPTIHDEDKPWLFMRLFNQERSIGWASRRVGGNNEIWIAVGIALVLLAMTHLARRRWDTARSYLDPETVGVLVMVLNPALVILFFQSGKASILPAHSGVFDEPFGCCSQAMIFPRTRVPMLIEFLQEEKQGQIDLLLDSLAQETAFTRYALYPVQAQHIGLDSSRMTERNEAQAIWSMAYENLDPKSLDKAHRQMVSEYYSSRALPPKN